MTMFIAAALFLAGAVIVGLILKNKTSAGRQEESPETAPATQQPSAADTFTDIQDALLTLNILVRKDRDFPETLTGKIETIIDDLVAITPAMMERYPGETLTYEIKKIGKEHLLKTVREYLDLSAESREQQLAMFETTIANLHEVTHRSRDIVEKNETAEFKTMANFLAGKFS